jgi:hypothetical protein
MFPVKPQKSNFAPDFVSFGRRMGRFETHVSSAVIAKFNVSLNLPIFSTKTSGQHSVKGSIRKEK